MERREQWNAGNVDQYIGTMEQYKNHGTLRIIWNAWTLGTMEQ